MDWALGRLYAMHPPNSIEDQIEKGYVRNIGSSISSPTSILRTPLIHNDRNSQIGENQNQIGKYINT
jgi:hypothetical protein